MTKREIIEVQLESIFGRKFPQKIQRLVDEELNQGRWIEGYDLAVCQGVVGADAARKLLEIVMLQHPTLRINTAAFQQAVDGQLAQSRFAPVKWIIDERGSFAITDSLRVARFDGDSIVWKSPRLSYDGIEFDSLKDGRLRGRGWLLSSSILPDVPFELDFETGELIKGQVVPE